MNQQLIDETRTRVRGYLQEIYPDFVEFDDGSFTVQEGSATVRIVAITWHEEDCAVECTSQLVTGANVTPDVMRWLLQKNVDLHFGALGLLFDDTIVYSQTLPGNDLTRAEFQATVRTVATIADYYDDEIVAMAGGSVGKGAATAAVAELDD
ncbi:MAG TPA: YbjN domain-containing protein [Candidatus Kapabacteria bacterium]|nr:YbjN domain-containing protein [Candidatus Kapabacteria bacterium]